MLFWHRAGSGTTNQASIYEMTSETAERMHQDGFHLEDTV